MEYLRLFTRNAQTEFYHVTKSCAVERRKIEILKREIELHILFFEFFEESERSGFVYHPDAYFAVVGDSDRGAEHRIVFKSLVGQILRNRSVLLKCKQRDRRNTSYSVRKILNRLGVSADRDFRDFFVVEKFFVEHRHHVAAGGRDFRRYPATVPRFTERKGETRTEIFDRGVSHVFVRFQGIVKKPERPAVFFDGAHRNVFVFKKTFVRVSSVSGISGEYGNGYILVFLQFRVGRIIRYEVVDLSDVVFHFLSTDYNK